MVRVRLAPTGTFRRDASWAVVPADSQAPKWGVQDVNGELRMTTAGLKVRIQRSPLRIVFEDANGGVLAADDPARGMAWTQRDVRCWKVLGEEDHVFGLGERTGKLDKRGDAVVNWNHDAAEHEPWSDPLYQAHPMMLVVNPHQSYGLFFDNTYRSSFDLGRACHEAYSFGAEGGELNYYVIPGPTPGDVLARFSKLVGATPLPPRWALGYQQCRFSYESARIVRKIAREFRERKIPCDTIYVDIDYMDGFRCFTWDPKRFAHPERLTQSLSKDGFKTVVIIDPGIKVERGYPAFDSGMAGNHFCYDAKGERYVGKVWPGDVMYPDFTRAETRRWWGDLYCELNAQGVAGFWNDMNEPADFTHASGTIPLDVQFDNDGERTDHREIHNVYGLLMARGTFEGIRRLRDNERPFVLTRSGYSGVHRYAAVWTGDNRSDWDHLRMSVPMLLNMGMSGLIFTGADIGGFRDHPSPELYTRWIQLGIFYPLCRTHTVGGPQQEPWTFGKRYERHNRAAIELRYRLMPYLYTEFEHAGRAGQPILRPVVLDHPKLDKVEKQAYEFMFGRQLFVAPVLYEGAKRRRFRLPPGAWFDFEDGTQHVGGEEIEMPVTLGSIPMFARGGAVVPMQRVVQFVDERPLDELILRIFPGDGGGSFYNDDGISYDHERGGFTREQYLVQTRDGEVAIRLAEREGTDRYVPAAYRLEFVGVDRAPRRVCIGDACVAKCKSGKSARQRSAGWFYDKKARTLTVRLRTLAVGEQVVVRTGG